MSGKRRAPVATWRNAVRDSDLGRTAKLVAFVLSTYLNGAGSAYPSRSTLAKGASVCDRAVDAAIAEVETAGFLNVKHTKGGWTRPNAYLAQLPNGEGASLFSGGNGERDDIQRRTARHSTAKGVRTKAVDLESESESRADADRRDGVAAAAYTEICGVCGDPFPTRDEKAWRCPDCEAKAAASLRGAPETPDPRCAASANGRKGEQEALFDGTRDVNRAHEQGSR